MAYPLFSDAAGGPVVPPPLPALTPPLNPANLRPFHCAGCGRVIGYTDEVYLVEGDHIRSMTNTIIHYVPGCGATTTWRPKDPKRR